MEQRIIDFFLQENITEKIKSVDGRKETALIFSKACEDVLRDCGIPYRARCVEAVCIHKFALHTCSAYFDKSRKQIQLFPSNIDANNFQYFHILCHETFHLIQDFIFECEITRDNINDLTQAEFERKVQQYFGTITLHENLEEYYTTFKHFIWFSPLFRRDIMAFMLFDYIKHSNVEAVYNCNIAEMTANAFAVNSMCRIFFDSTSPLSSQIELIRLCIEYDIMRLDEGIEVDKKRACIIQNLLSSPLSHIRYNRKKKRMNLELRFSFLPDIWNKIYDLTECSQTVLYPVFK